MTDSSSAEAIPGLPFLRRGKVRDLYDFGDHLLLVATDRVSAFDVILPNLLPGKGKILTRISTYWFGLLADVVDHHVVETDVNALEFLNDEQRDALRDRTVYCRKWKPLPFEFIVRGYITGGGLLSYQREGAICGIALPSGLREGDKLAEPIFTPTTKAKLDADITFDHLASELGIQRASRLREVSLELYRRGQEHAARKGILIADTKFEFAWDEVQDQPVLIDEALTPDSSRFWPADEHEVGVTPPSYDKQIVRNYLLTLDWNKKAPGPPLSEEIIARTMGRYRELCERLTGSAPP